MPPGPAAGRSKPVSRDQQFRDFAETGCNPDEWLLIANSLLESAKYIQNALGTIPRAGVGEEFDRPMLRSIRPLQLCLHFALENALKAVLVARGQIFPTKNWRLLLPRHEAHNLVVLSALAASPSRETMRLRFRFLPTVELGPRDIRCRSRSRITTNRILGRATFRYLGRSSSARL